MTVTVRPYAATDTLSEAAPVETPFLEVYEAPIFPSGEMPETAEVAETPFLSEYSVGEDVVGPATGMFRQLLGELYDSEFDETLLELVDEADAHAELMGQGETGMDEVRVELALNQWIEPLRIEAETLLGSMAEALDASDAQALSEGELDELLNGFEPQETSGGPVFEDFLKKLWNKAKGAVKGAVNLAKKGIAAVGKLLPIGMILNKIKALVRPLLQRVLKLALNRLPAALRPAAAQLASRLFGVKEVDEDEVTAGTESLASPDVRTIQAEFDTEVATLLLAPAEPEQETLIAEATIEAERLDDPSLGELDGAREAFVAQLMELQEGEDPTPVVEQFLPAILPVLRMGIGIVGRPKVVRFLAGLLGRLIAPYVGPSLTPPLSRAIVDAGLRLMTLESGDEEQAEPGIAAEAFAALVEDTASAVAELDEEELEDEAAVEEVALEAFHRSARSQFPSSVLRPNAGGAGQGTWVAMPRRGPKRYRKFSRVFNVTIRPDAAAAITTRSGRSLASFIKDRLGREGAVMARLHLYQAVPGTRVGRIARAERGVRGLGPSARVPQSEFHPLTREAAGALLGEPELGQDVAEAYLEEAAPAAIGQRFYYLEVEGGRPTATGATPGAANARPRMSETTAAIDLRRREVKLAIYLSEAQAQTLAARLRRREPIGSVLRTLRPTFAEGIRSLASASGRRRLRVVGEAEEPMSEELVRIPGMQAPSGMVGKLLRRWTRGVIGRELDRQRDEFATAASAPRDGVTLVVKVAQPPGLSAVAQLLRGRGGAGIRALADLPRALSAQPASGSLSIEPGYQRA